MEAERFLLKWNNHQSNLVTVFDQLYEQEAFTDVTLACDGKSFAAHKVILSACSPYFQNLFLANPNTHPIVFMRDVRASDLESLLAFMYRGEINVHQRDLAYFLKTAESLQIKGLSDSSARQRDTSKILEAMEKKFNTANNNNNIPREPPPAPPPPPPPPSVPPSVPASSPYTPTVPSIGSPGSAFGIGGFSRGGSGLGSMGGLRLGSTLNGSLASTFGGLGARLPGLTSSGNGHMDSLGGSNVTSSESRSPPAKRHRSLEDLPRILPKVRTALTSPQSLVSNMSSMSNIPGLLTPITLAAAAVNSVAAQPHLPILANTPTSVHASPPTPETSSSSPATDIATPPKEVTKKEYYTGSDSPHHSVYLGNNSAGGVGSGSSTPSLDVKEEDGENFDDSSCLCDEPARLSDDMNMGGMYSDDVLTTNRERLTYPCRYCGKRFTQTGTCRRHERLHTQPNGFKCPFCQKGFNRKYRLKEHIISVHPSNADETDLSMLVNSAAASGLA